MKILLSDIKEIIQSNDKCFFTYYKNNCLHYSFFFNGYECVFPIPTVDLGNTKLKISEKPIKLLGYIRNSIENNTIKIKEIE